MKTIIIPGLLLFLGVMINSCQKDEVNNEFETAGPLKVVLIPRPTPDLPIIMNNEDRIGSASIAHDPVENVITVTAEFADLPAGWEVTCAHLYADEEIPASAAPGLFPYKDCELPVSVSIKVPDIWDYCEGLTWYYALHFELRMQTGTMTDVTSGKQVPTYDYETAWVLPHKVEGIKWFNKKGKNTTGWGEYFPWKLTYTPEISNLNLIYTNDLTTVPIFWTQANAQFIIGLDKNKPYYYFTTYIRTNVPLKKDEMNPFFLNEVKYPAFWDYWAAKGVDGVNNSQGWELIMWKIINGDLPIFFLIWDGRRYALADGLQYAVGQIHTPPLLILNPLRINGNYPPGTYSFTGDLMGEYCIKNDFIISITFKVIMGYS